ncbi:MAG: TonB-dependent receptor [Caulobacteraceae bacterium]|nr:TonB-dependent receptor [Caulobacteraceae bacterium]
MNRNTWLIGVSLAALSASTAVWAADAAPVATAAAAEVAPEIVVYGHGETRQIQTITAKQIEQVAPGSSPLKVLATLPGVNFQSSDPFGSYEWSTRISVRGFNQNQLGFTLDGVPLGDMSYGNYNGLHISRAISSENIGKSDLAAGVGALGTASSSNLGGTVEFTSRDPSSTPGILGSATYGSYDTQHEFIRIDSGDIIGGGRGYLSFSNQSSQKWKGYGKQKQQQINSKFIQPIGNAKVTALFNYSDRAENDYQDLSLGLIKNFGYKLDNISHDWATATQIANVYQYNAPLIKYNKAHPNDPQKVLEPYPMGLTDANTSGTDPADAVYYNGSGLRKDAVGALKLDWDLTQDLSVHFTGYGHHDQGQGTWDTPYVPTPGGAPISIRTTEYDIARGGVIGAIDYNIAGHAIEAGFWYEDNDFNEGRRYYGLDASGTNRNNLEFQKNAFWTDWYGKFNTRTLEFHLQDTWKVTDALKVYAGFKSLNVDVKATQLPGTLAAGKIKSDENFLPQAGVNYALDGSNELFAGYAKNMRAFVGANTAGPFSASQAGFDAIKNKLKPEISQTVEAGYRYRSGAIQGSIAAYYVKFDNRLLTVSVGSAIVGAPNALENVGSVTSTGVELQGAWKFAQSWSLSGSYAYNDSTYDNDVYDGDHNLLAKTSGKTVVDAPKNIANVTLGFDDGSLFGNVTASYMSKRYFTYLNDESVPGRTLVDLSLGYRFHQDGWLKGVEIQGNVTNLFNEKYVSTIGSNGYGNSGDNQTLQAGSPTEGFITVKKQF